MPRNYFGYMTDHRVTFRKAFILLFFFMAYLCDYINATDFIIIDQFSDHGCDDTSLRFSSIRTTEFMGDDGGGVYYECSEESTQVTTVQERSRAVSSNSMKMSYNNNVCYSSLTDNYWLKSFKFRCVSDVEEFEKSLPSAASFNIKWSYKGKTCAKERFQFAEAFEIGYCCAFEGDHFVKYTGSSLTRYRDEDCQSSVKDISLPTECGYSNNEDDSFYWSQIPDNNEMIIEEGDVIHHFALSAAILTIAVAVLVFSILYFTSTRSNPVLPSVDKRDFAE